MSHTIMLIDDDVSELQQLRQIIKETWRCEVICASSGRQATEHLLLRMEPKPHLIIVSLAMTDMSAIEVIRSVRCSHKILPIIAIGGQGSRYSLQALQSGASDIICRPLNLEQLRFAIQALMQQRILHDEQERLTRLNQEKVGFGDIIGMSEVLKQAVAKAQHVTDSSIPVLIEGEQGVGKEWLARAIHGSGSRAGERFLAVNCAYQCDESIEQLIHAILQNPTLQGADINGKFRSFSRGTLFLRNIHALSMHGQRALLDAVRQMTSHPSASVRLIATSSQALVTSMRQGFFRKDLYDELSRFIIIVPPLRERPSDVTVLAEHFVSRCAAFEGRTVYGLAPECIPVLERHDWHGNVRELSQCMHHAVLQSDGLWITPAMLKLEGDEYAVSRQAERLGQFLLDTASHIDCLSPEGHVRKMEEIEAELIRYAIRFYKGKMTEVARRLGIGRSTLYRKIQDYELDIQIRHAA